MAPKTDQRKSPLPLAMPGNGGSVTPRVKTETKTATAKRNSRFGLWFLLTFILLAAGLTAYHFLSVSDATAATASTSKHGGARDKNRVVGATATQGDIRVYLSGPRSVVPKKQVTVPTPGPRHPQKGSFPEGKPVNE